MWPAFPTAQTTIRPSRVHCATVLRQLIRQIAFFEIAAEQKCLRHECCARLDVPGPIRDRGGFDLQKYGRSTPIFTRTKSASDAMPRYKPSDNAPLPAATHRSHHAVPTGNVACVQRSVVTRGGEDAVIGNDAISWLCLDRNAHKTPSREKPWSRRARKLLVRASMRKGCRQDERTLFKHGRVGIDLPLRSLKQLGTARAYFFYAGRVRRGELPARLRAGNQPHTLAMCHAIANGANLGQFRLSFEY
jgi:hypothetical protein